MEPQIVLQLTTSLLCGYLLLLCLCKTTTALTGLCGTDKGRTTCFACSELRDLGAAPLDCCGDPYVFSLCHACVFDPSSCDEARSKLSRKAQDLVNANFIRQQRSPAKSKGELMQLMSFKPQRRAKYFLGKRDSASPFLGKRTMDESALANIYDEEKRGANPFLGKRANPFLGKRMSELLNEAQDYASDNNGFSKQMDQQVEIKRQNPFLGKRANAFLGKRMSDLLSEAEIVNNYDAVNTPEAHMPEAKRQNPFLGKRYAQTPWSNKESVNDEPDTLFTEKDIMSKRTSPFLGKRAIGPYVANKRADSQDNGESGKSFYTRPLTRRAKYFLGKRSEGENSPQSKRAKYFLGKREAAEEVGLMPAEGYVNMHDTALAPDVSADKRSKYFLGKRDVKEVSSLADESPAEIAQ